MSRPALGARAAWPSRSAARAKSIPTTSAPRPPRAPPAPRSARDVEPALSAAGRTASTTARWIVGGRVCDLLERAVPPDERLPLLQLLECHRQASFLRDSRDYSPSDGIGSWTRAERYGSATESYEIFRLDALQEHVRRRAPAVHAARPARERAPHGRRGATSRRSRAGSRPTSRAARSPSGPSRVLLQDFTGVPGDRRPRGDARRDAGPRRRPGADQPACIPAELVIDHSVQVDEFATRLALRPQRRARVRAEPRALRVPALGPAGVRRPQGRPAGHRHRPPGQPRVPRARRRVARTGRPSRTRSSAPTRTRRWSTASACSAGASAGSRPRRRCSARPLSMLVPQVVGFRLTGALPEGATATDLVLTVTRDPAQDRRRREVRRVLRRRASPRLSLADRATIGNMSPEYGATCGFFPVDDETLHYLRLTGRPDERIALVEAYCKENMLWHEPDDQPTYSQVVELDLGDVEPSLAGPRRPQDRVPLARREGRVPRTRCRASASTTATAEGRGGRRELPGQRPARARRARATRSRRRAGRGRRGRRAPSPRASRVRARRRASSSSTTARRDRRDHELHEHVEPAGDGRRRAAREEGGRARPRRASRG